MAVLPDGRLVVADRGNNRIQILGSQGMVIGGWGSHGPADGQFDHPEDACVDARRARVYVCDMNNRRVQVFTLRGRWLASFPPAETPLNRPADIALSPSGDAVFVLDIGDFRVLKFSLEGDLLTSWGEWGEGASAFRSPLDVETDAAGRVYVSDAANANVQVFTATGELLSVVASPQDPFRYPSAVAPIAGDRLLVADFAADRIRCFKLDGTALGEFGRAGHEPGSLHYPSDIQFSSGLLYVSEMASNRITVFDLTRWLERL